MWFALLADPAAAERSRPDRWSTLEYACHVHDVHQIYHDRVCADARRGQPALRQLGPGQVCRSTGRYADQLPSIVGPTLVAAAYAIGDLYESVPPTVLAAARAPQRRPRVHDRVAREVPAARRRPPPPRRAVRRAGGDGPGVRRVRRRLPRRAPRELPATRALRRSNGSPGLVPPGRRVLEIGSGSGRDARRARGGAGCPYGGPTSRRRSSSCSGPAATGRPARPARRRPGRPGRARHAVRRRSGPTRACSTSTATTCRRC